MAARKKTAKKKIVKKKVVKRPRKPKPPRKPSRKVQRRKPRPIGLRPRKDWAKDSHLAKIVIFRRDDLEGAPLFVDTRSADVSVGRGDRVVWFNSTNQKVVLTFKGDATKWPFAGAKHDIDVSEYNESSVYFVKKKGEFAYVGEPPISGPPGDPVVDAGD